MNRLSLFWSLICKDKQIPDMSFKKLRNFSFGVSLLFTAALTRPIDLLIAGIAVAPLAVIFTVSLIVCLLISAVWFWWQEAGRLIKKDIDNLVKSSNIHPSTSRVIIMKDQYLNAISLARMEHAGQIDIAGNDYFAGHLMHVAARFTDNTEKAVAILHDIIEDTPLNAGDLRNLGVSGEIITAVEIVTRHEGEQYRAFITRIADSEDELAIAIKIADLKDHLEDRHAINDSLIKRYTAALDILSKN